MAEPVEKHAEPQRGTVDLVSVLYVLGGVPALIAFFAILFLAVRACGDLNIQIPA
jgi:hypothetical protein